MKRDFLRMWAEGLLSARPSSVSESMTVVGERNAHLGPRLEYASVQVSVEPAAQFEVTDLAKASEEIRKFGYPESVVLGILDVLMVSLASPISNIRLILDKPKYDAVNSSPMAFRQAGRDAGRKIIEAMTEGA